MLKAIKLRLYIDDQQAAYVNKLLGSCRFIYNQLLAYRIDKYNNEKQSVSFGDLGKRLTMLKQMDEYSWLNDVHSKVLQQSMINLEAAYKSFFRNGNGFPKFKSRKDNKQSCRFPMDAIGKIKGNRINIIKPLKDIHFKCSRKDEMYLNKHQKMIRSATLTKTKSGHYYFSILIDRQTDKQLPTPKNDVTGIDLGIKTFIVCSDGTSYDNIKIKRNNQKKLVRLHRCLSRKVNGSKNKDKARIKLAKYHEKLNNIKENYLHHITNELLNDNQVIAIEDLNVKGMMKNHCLAKSIQELSLFRFKEMLTYKAEWYGRDIVQIDRFFPSSKLCSNCGWKNDTLTLNDRTWICSECHTTHDRDVNACINIQNEGKRIINIGLSSPELTSVDSSGYTLYEAEKKSNFIVFH